MGGAKLRTGSDELAITFPHSSSFLVGWGKVLSKDDMPRIVKYVSEECKKHLYSSRGNLFQFYQDYMERMKK
jgi:hypothetical protein